MLMRGRDWYTLQLHCLLMVSLLTLLRMQLLYIITGLESLWTSGK
jgi:hypothetical protein